MSYNFKNVHPNEYLIGRIAHIDGALYDSR